MKKGFGLVKCGQCLHDQVVGWPGYKYKVKCQYCNAMMSIHRQRLKHFKEYKEGAEHGND